MYLLRKSVGFSLLQDKWLLHSISILVQVWIEPLADLQDSLNMYDNVPSSLISKTRWMSTKLMNLKQGVLVLMSKVRSRNLGMFSLRSQSTL